MASIGSSLITVLLSEDGAIVWVTVNPVGRVGRFQSTPQYMLNIVHITQGCFVVLIHVLSRHRTTSSTTPLLLVRFLDSAFPLRPAFRTSSIPDFPADSNDWYYPPHPPPKKTLDPYPPTRLLYTASLSVSQFVSPNRLRCTIFPMSPCASLSPRHTPLLTSIGSHHPKHLRHTILSAGLNPAALCSCAYRMLHALQMERRLGRVVAEGGGCC